MEEYKRLYKLYQTKADSELEEILNPGNGYTATAIKVASDILQYGRIGCEETIQKQGGTILLPDSNITEAESKDRLKTPNGKEDNMALIKCPDCGKEISNAAKTCPNCGKPMNPVTSSKIILWVIAGICGIVALLVLLSGGSDLLKIM